jgi:hypothetical protein
MEETSVALDLPGFNSAHRAQDPQKIYALGRKVSEKFNSKHQNSILIFVHFL